MAVDVNTILPRMTHEEKSFAVWLLLQKDYARRESTIRNHIRHLRWLTKSEVSLTDYESFDAFIATLTLNEYSTSARNNYIGTIRVINRYYKEKGLPFNEQLLNYKDFRDVYREKGIMNREEVEAFLSMEPVKTTRRHQSGKLMTYFNNEKAFRMWTMFFTIVAYTGMRPGEVATLEVNEVDFGLGVFSIPAHKVKTRKGRRVPIPESIKSDLEKYIRGLDGAYLFPAKSKKGVVSSTQWGYNFHDRIKRLGIKRDNLTPYSLRHTYGTEMASNENVNLFELKNLMGHSDIRMTEHYYHRSLDRLKSAAIKHYSNIKNVNLIKLIFEFAMRMEIEKYGYGYEFTENEFRVWKKED